MPLISMKEHLKKCLFTILIVSYLLVSLGSANNQADDDGDGAEDAESVNFYQSLEKPDWVDHGNMFSFDPLTKTNREFKFQEVASNLIKKQKERREDGDDEQDYCYNDCSELSNKLRHCEAAQKQYQCDCLVMDNCGARSYQIIRRLVILLEKQLTRKYSRGSILELKVNLDDIFFEMPEDINNSSDCSYLSFLHPLVDQLLPLIVVYHPEPSVASSYLSFKFVATGIGISILVFFWIKMTPKLKLISLVLAFWIIVTIWEYIHLYQTETAKQEEKLNRLKVKCESHAQPSWFGLIASMMPDVTFKSEVSECTEYYVATRVNPLLAVNPVMAFSKVYEVTILYAMKLTANATGASLKVFFNHIPSLYVPVFLLAGVAILIYSIKYCFKYRSKGRKPKASRQKSVVREQVVPRIRNLSPSPQRAKGLPQRVKKYKNECLIARYGSTGNIQKLCL